MKGYALSVYVGEENSKAEALGLVPGHSYNIVDLMEV